MKKIVSLAAVMLLMAGDALAENIQTIVVIPSPKMTCQNCENRIKGRVKFVKGTKKIETNVPNNTVTITFDADKAKLADYEEAFKKIGREIKVAEDATKPAPVKR